MLGPGDIINVDVTTELDGYHGDTSATFCIGGPTLEARRLVDPTRAASLAGIVDALTGARRRRASWHDLGDIRSEIVDIRSPISRISATLTRSRWPSTHRSPAPPCSPSPH